MENRYSNAFKFNWTEFYGKILILKYIGSFVYHWIMDIQSSMILERSIRKSNFGHF